MLLEQRNVFTVTVFAQNVPRLACVQALSRMRQSSVSRPYFFSSLSKPFLFLCFSGYSIISFTGLWPNSRQIFIWELYPHHRHHAGGSHVFKFSQFYLWLNRIAGYIKDYSTGLHKSSAVNEQYLIWETEEIIK